MRVTYCDRCGKETESPIRTLGKKCWTEREEELHYPKTPYLTNADRIRAMTDEELARWRSRGQCPTWRYHGDYDCMNRSCKDCWLEWLKQEIKTN